MSPRSGFLFLYFLSGATALLYQVVWSRALTLEMGQTAAAVSTVLAAFMGGLALGAALGGRAAGRTTPAMAARWYAALEMTIAAAAILVAPLLALATTPLAAAYADGHGGLPFALLRLAISLVVIAVPATAMGATLPFAVRWLEGAAPSSAGRLAGALYAANTLGAAGGAALTGFLLLPSLGLSRTTWLGAAVNIAVAAGAWRLSGSNPAYAAPVASNRRQKKADRLEPARPGLAALALFLSGLAALVHEVAWTRVLALLIGPTTYAFTTMVSTFIVGLAVGGAVGVRLLKSGRSPGPLLAGAQIAAALGAVAAAGAVPRLTLVVAGIVSAPDRHYAAVLGLEAAIVFAVLLPLTAALGASFPFAVALAHPADAAEASNATGRDGAARATARVYAANTVGAILGALGAGFVLLPRLGLQGTILLAALLGLVAAAVVAAIGTRSTVGRAAVLLGAILALMGSRMPPWSRTMLSGGFYRHASGPAIDPSVEIEAGTLLYYGDGPTGTVSVRRVAGETSLAINGKVDASDAGDMLTQKLLAHLPLLLHPAPQHVAIVGHGSGVTAGAALRHPVVRVDAIELSPEVVRASRFFDRASGAPLDDRRTRLVLGDGRTHMRLARAAYDVIVSEPSNPWMAGVAPLFTQEMFQAVRDRLRPGGVFCQWAHTYQMSEADLGSIVATFLSVFPDGSLWLVGEADVLLVAARDGGLGARIAALPARWASSPGIADLESVKLREADSLLSLHVASGPDLALLAAGAGVQTDDRTSLEFSAPLTLYGRGGAALVDRLHTLGRAARQPPSVAAALESTRAPSWAARAEMQLAAGAFEPAHRAATRALELDAASPASEVLAETGPRLGRGAETGALFERLIGQNPAVVPLRVALSRLLANAGDAAGARRVALDATHAQPADPRAWEQLASVLGDLGDDGALEPVVRTLEELAPGSWGAAYYAATLAFLRGELPGAIAKGLEAAALRPADGRALNLVGAARAIAGDTAGAREAFTSSLARAPKDAASYVNLARLELEAASPRLAATLFAQALVLDPSSSAARDGLRQARDLAR